MAKKAVLIGCNYPGTGEESELKGCVNDVLRMYRCLVEIYGFAEEDITMLIDTDDSFPQPTGRNIRSALADLVISAVPGDTLFVHYSGHGTRIEAANDSDNTGYDECIVPTDINLITDDEFRELVDNVPKGCKITIVSDSCQSGGLIDAAKEQIGDSTSTRRKNEQLTNNDDSVSETQDVEDTTESRGIRIKEKSLSLPILVEMLKQKSDKTDISTEGGKLKEVLFTMFGEDTTPKIKNFRSKLQEQDLDVAGVVLGLVGAVEYIEHKLNIMNTNSLSLSDNGILISGCQSYQTSADVRPLVDDGDGSAYGALSDAIQKVIEQTGGKVSNRELVMKTRMLMMREGFDQRPGLYCSDDRVDEPFICSLD